METEGITMWLNAIYTDELYDDVTRLAYRGYFYFLITTLSFLSVASYVHFKAPGYYCFTELSKWLPHSMGRAQDYAFNSEPLPPIPPSSSGLPESRGRSGH